MGYINSAIPSPSGNSATRFETDLTLQGLR
jgi:hypothetical protein